MTGTISDLDLVAQIARASHKTVIEKEQFRRISKDVVTASGDMSLDDINTLFDTALQSTYHQVTIGGWLAEKLGMIPKSGTSFEESGFLFRIVAADPTKVTKVYIQRLTSRQRVQKRAKSGAK